MSFIIGVDQKSIADSLLGDFQRRMDNPRPLAEAYGSYMLQSAQRSFATETSPDGVPFAALAASTLERKRRAGKAGNKILVFSGVGQNSVRVRISRDRAELRTEDYMDYHRTGTSRMPARRITPTLPKATSDARAIAFAYGNPRKNSITINGITVSWR